MTSSNKIRFARKVNLYLNQPKWLESLQNTTIFFYNFSQKKFYCFEKNSVLLKTRALVKKQLARIHFFFFFIKMFCSTKHF